MPELPEVESIKRQLNKFLVGHKFKEVIINYQKSFKGNKDAVLGKKVQKIERAGKALIIKTEGDYDLVIHVKMTGQLIYKGPNLKKSVKISDKVKGGLGGKHSHVVFLLDKGGKLYFNDYRKFGWIRVVRDEELEKDSFLKKLGPEPLKDLTEDRFLDIVKKNKGSIKLLLMNQSKIAGIGNIYANDALFLAKINPQKKSNTISKKKIDSLFDAIEVVLKKAIRLGGASELAFVTPDGSEGSYQKSSLVYGREGERCPNKCGNVIKKIKLSGRGTYFCPGCQK